MPPCVPIKLAEEYRHVISKFGPEGIKFTTEQVKEIVKDADTYKSVHEEQANV